MLEAIKKIVVDAGELIRCVQATPEDIMSKEGRVNYVTRYDVMVQEYLFLRLQQLIPEATMIGEETAEERNAGDGYAFIVDPIDGTNNFIAGFHYSCISVGLALDGKVIMGVVYNPFNQEMFWAERGQGAWKKAAYSDVVTRMQVIDRSIRDGLVCVATAPYYPELTEKSLLLARKILEKGTDIRRLASAALELCHVADRRSVLFFELLLAPWDHAAAGLILEEAGGIVTTMEGSTTDLNVKHSLLAGTPTAYAEFVQMLQEAKKEYPQLAW